jgi:acyl-CoA hydrolase
MPVVGGLPELGDNKIHVDEIDFLVESDQNILEVPETEPNEVERKIAENVAKLLRSGDTLQFGIGAIPDEVARILASTDLSDFGVHSELISNGFLTLMESGKISGARKGLHEGKSVFAFALGNRKLYDFLDERKGNNRGRVVAAPVSYVNDSSVIARHRNMVSVNSGFMIDFSGQVSSEAIGERQYSGVGGQLNFVEGAFFSPGGRSILCIKSSVVRKGKRSSNIVDALPPGSIVSTPRHYVQHVVTEYGSVNLFGLTDEERPAALASIAHPDFREDLRKAAKKRDKAYYHTRGPSFLTRLWTRILLSR